MDQTKRVLVQEGLKELWTKELSPLIESYRPTDPNDEEQWLCFEGAMYHMEELLRRHIMIKCGRKPESMFRRQYPRYVNEETQRIHAQENEIERGYKIANLMEKLSLRLEMLLYLMLKELNIMI